MDEYLRRARELSDEEIARSFNNNRSIEWATQPLRARELVVYNASMYGLPEVNSGYVLNPEKVTGVKQWRRQLLLHLFMPEAPLKTEGRKFLRWLGDGSQELPAFKLKPYLQLAQEMLGKTAAGLADDSTITSDLPSASIEYLLNKKLGVMVSSLQMLLLSTLVQNFATRGMLAWEQARWVYHPKCMPIGIAQEHESVAELAAAVVSEVKKTAFARAPELGPYPLVFGVNAQSSVPEEKRNGAVYLFHRLFLQQAIPPIRTALQALPRQPTADEVAGMGTLGELMELLFRSPQVHVGAPEPEPKGEEDPPLPAYTPARGEEVGGATEDGRKAARKLKRVKGLDQLPDVLEGLDAFQALYATAGNNGLLFREFQGRPMVLERLREEAADAQGKPEAEDEEDIPAAPRTTTGETHITPLAEVVRGKLVFANRRVFGLMQQRRYSGRGMMKTLKLPLDRHLADIQVLAPHEFGQVPGFVAGQYRPLMDRLCVVMITFDPELWGMTLRERKVLISDSRAPKLWVFPSGWLQDLTQGEPWYHAGLFGTPKDPAIADFTNP